jgi:hypothetical protein
MHRCRSWILFGVWTACLAPISGSATTVYKWIDAQGVVHFSDQPVEGAERIITSSGPGHNGIMAESTPTTAKPESKKKQTLADAQINISSPSQEQTFTGGESVPVRLSMTPALGPGQQITWTLNGAQVQNQGPDAQDFTLADLARGVYTIEATVTDPATGETKSTDPVTFNVMRPSVFSPQHK